MITAFHGLIGVSPPMQDLYRLIGKVAPNPHSVLILGESGTGKELVARAIHDLGPRGRMLFLPVDCASLTPTLIESELFGHTRGAFTGATQTKQGLLAIANGGTLFLDEIGELPVDMQAKLLRAMQEKEIRPVGSNGHIRTNVRVVAATNRDLEEGVRNGTFRQDLFFRLNVVQIKLPPLRERKNDIPLLVNHFLQKFSNAQRAMTISEEAMEKLVAYDWPGNVRELENAIERALALSSNAVLQADDLPPGLLDKAATPSGSEEFMPLRDLERQAIFRALRETGDSKLSAARLLGIGKTTLYRKLKKYSESSLSPETGT